MADEDTVMLAIPIDRSLHARLKIGATMVNTSMKAYVITLLEMGTPEFSADGSSVAFSSESMPSMIRGNLYLAGDQPDDEANT